MSIKFKNQLKGERVVLARTKPTLKMAREMFETVDNNRGHLIPWFPWVFSTKRVEDSFGYLFNKEKETEKGSKVEYGIYVNKKYIGNISIFDINNDKKSAEIGYWISSSFVRNGYTTEAVRVLEKEAFENFGLNRIQIRCDEENKASSGVAKKCGYEYEGKLREYSFSKHFNNFRNMLFFSKLKSEYGGE